MLRLDAHDARPRLDPVGVGDRLGLDRGQLGEEHVAGDPDRAVEGEFVADRVADRSADRDAVAEQGEGTGDVEERFIERQRLDDRRVAIEDRPHVPADRGVQRVIAGEEHGVRASAPCDRRRHRRAHAVSTSLVRRGRHHAARARAPDDDRLTHEFGAAAQFDRHEECVHVGVEDRAPLRANIATGCHSPSLPHRRVFAARYDPPS